MRAAIALTTGTVLFIALRVYNTDVQIFTLLWWSWLIMTAVTSAACGWAWCSVWTRYKKKRTIK